MCLQAHYRSELEFSWEGLGAALTRLKRLVMASAILKTQAQSASQPGTKLAGLVERFDAALSDDLNTAIGLTVLEEAIALKKTDPGEKLAAVAAMDAVLGLGLLDIERTDLRMRPASAAIVEAEIEAQLPPARKPAPRGTMPGPMPCATNSEQEASKSWTAISSAGSGSLTHETLALTRAPFVPLDGARAELYGARHASPGRPLVNFTSEAGLPMLVALRYLPGDLAGIDEDYVLGWTEVAVEPERLHPGQRRAVAA
jgi:hypothetical protein